MKKDNKNKIIAAVTPIVIVVLTIIGSVKYDSWLKYLENLAKKGYFFNEIASMVGSEWGNSSLLSIGMTNYTEYKFGGQMYKYELSDIRNIDYLVKYYPTLVKLYEKEYGEKNNNDNK